MEAQMEQFVAWLKKIDNLQDAKTVEEINKLHNDWKAAAANFGEMVTNCSIWASIIAPPPL